MYTTDTMPCSHKLMLFIFHHTFELYKRINDKRWHIHDISIPFFFSFLCKWTWSKLSNHKGSPRNNGHKKKESTSPWFMQLTSLHGQQVWSSSKLVFIVLKVSRLLDQLSRTSAHCRFLHMWRWCFCSRNRCFTDFRSVGVWWCLGLIVGRRC